MNKFKLMVACLFLIVSVSLIGCTTAENPTERMSALIRQNYYEQYIQPNEVPLQLDELEIYMYYGTFNGAVVVMFNTPARQVIGQLEIDGLVIHFNDSRRIVVWYDGGIYDLLEAFEVGIISSQALLLIANIQNDIRANPVFSYENLIISLTESTSAAATANGRVFTPEDFPEVALSRVDILSEAYPPINRIMLVLTLQTPGRTNVICALIELSMRDDVYWVSLNYFESTQLIESYE